MAGAVELQPTSTTGQESFACVTFTDHGDFFYHTWVGNFGNKCLELQRLFSIPLANLKLKKMTYALISLQSACKYHDKNVECTLLLPTSLINFDCQLAQIRGPGVSQKIEVHPGLSQNRRVEPKCEPRLNQISPPSCNPNP